MEKMAKRELLDYYGEKKTKKEIGEMCREVLKNRSPNQILKGKDYELAFWVYRKRGNELIEPLIFSVRRNLDGQYNAFAFLNSLREWETFSYLKALQTDEQNRKKKVIKAFRQEVNQQIRSFRHYQLDLEENVSLALLNEINPNKVHTDHVIPLKNLIEDFLIENGKTGIEEVEIEPYVDSKGRKWLRIADRNLALKWQIYHLENAELAITTSKENLQLAVKRRRK